MASEDNIGISSRRVGRVLPAPEEVHLPDTPRSQPKRIAKHEATLRRKHATLRGSEVRHVRTRGAALYTGMHPMSRLDGKMMAGEGSIEQDFWIIADFAFDDLIDALAQPFKTSITIRGITSSWTPDGLLKRRARRDTLVECKPLAFLQPDPEQFPYEAAIARERYYAWKKTAESHDMDFIAISEDDVRLEPRFHNALVMHRAEGNYLDQDSIDAIVDGLTTLPPKISVNQLAKILGPFDNSALLIACQLDRLGYIRLDRKDYFTPAVVMENHMSGRLPGTSLEFAALERQP